MKIVADGFVFDFTDARHVFVFDETDRTKATYHGVTRMKAVDIIVELEHHYLFVEMKEMYDPERYTQERMDNTYCQVVNMERWNAAFPKWPVRRWVAGSERGVEGEENPAPRTQ